MPAYVIIDGQWGSTGKGKLAGYLAQRKKPRAVACDFMSNAGHTYVDGGGAIITYHIPTGGLFTDGPILLGPGCGITVETLFREVEELRGFDVGKRLLIHPHALTIERRHAEREAVTTMRVASTMKGCGAALAEKVERNPALKLAKDVPLLAPFVADTVEVASDLLRRGALVQVEGAQGFGLSLDYGFYPYVTSRNVIPVDILSRAGVPAHYLTETWGCLRTYPIRVGNVEEEGRVRGVSGPCFPDQVEVSWEDVQRRSGSPRPLTERTTVTNRVRRVFTFSDEQFRQFSMVCAPSHLFLNFANHLTHEASMVDDWGRLPLIVKDFLRRVSSKDVKGMLVGTGAENSAMVKVPVGHVEP